MQLMKEEHVFLLGKPSTSFSYRRFCFLFIGFISFLGCSSIYYYYFPTSTSLISTRQDETILSFPGKMDLIKSLPGLSHDVKEKQYSGYLSISNGGKIHYWFVESQTNPHQDPVVLWLNGGPGASSLGGIFYENGPFIIQDDGIHLKRNPYAWNKEANVLYIESPVGVGFSFNHSGIYESNDFLQAQENHEALQLFFQKFPHLQKNEFYIIGESYGGVYVPTLAKAIVESSFLPKINLKGFAVGNGVNEFVTNSQLFFAYYHGLIGSDEWKSLQQACPDLKEFTIPKFNFFDVATGKNLQNKCGQERLKALSNMMSSHINTYDIYMKCKDGNPTFGLDQFLHDLLSPSSTSSSFIIQPIGLPLSLCLNSTAGKNYLNQDKVKKALHIPLELSWSDIVMTNASTSGFKALNLTIDKPILYYGMPLQGHVVDIWKMLLDKGVRGVIYHGDVDFMCDFIGGQWATDSLELPVTTPYQPWFINASDGTTQTAGFIKQYDKDLTFITIKGAGHMAPQWKPKETFEMYMKYILKK